MLNHIYLQNTGSTQTVFRNNFENHFNKMQWNANYDGNQAKIRVKTNDDGIKHKYYYNLDNRDLAHLLNIDSVRMPIDKRLKRDFKKKPCLKRYGNVYKIVIPDTDTDIYRDTDTDTDLSNFLSRNDTDDSDSTVWTTIPSSNHSTSFNNISLGDLPMDDNNNESPELSSLTYTPQNSIDVSKIRDTLELLNTSTRDSERKGYLSSPSLGEEFIVPISVNQGPYKKYKKYTFTPKRRNLTLKTHRSYRVFKHPKKKTARRRHRRTNSLK